MTGTPPRYLADILAANARRTLRASPRAPSEPRPFRPAIDRARGRAIVAEVKAASPSRGELLRGRDPAALAAAYEAAGARAVSVVTEESRFRGSLDMLLAVREGCRLPILRKDFLTRREEIHETAAWGASAVLLIARLLAPADLASLIAEAGSCGLDALVEVHDEEDLRRARDAGAALVGVNNRDLDTFHVDLSVCEGLAPRLPEDATWIAESGIESPRDIARMRAAGFHGFLVGEALLRAEDPAQCLRTLAGTA